MLNRNVAILGTILVATILGSAGIWYQTSSADITNESKADMFNFMKDTYVSLVECEDALEDIADTLESTADFAEDQDKFNDSVFDAVTDIRRDIGQLKLEIALIKAGGSTDIPSSDFDLMICADYNCTDQTQRFNQGDVVYVRGQNPSNDRSLNYKVYDSDDIRQDSRQVSLQPNGPFIVAYTIPSNAEDGAYKLIVEIDNEEDQISFIVD